MWIRFAETPASVTHFSSPWRGRHTEAFLQISHAVKLDPGNLELLGERCDNLQFHFALQDAEEMVQLSPDCWLGHRSRAEVHLATLNYSQAIAAYQVS